IAADRDEGHRQVFDRRSTAVDHLDDERLSQTLAHRPILTVAAHDAQLDSRGAGIGEGEILTAPDQTGHEERSQAMAIEFANGRPQNMSVLHWWYVRRVGGVIGPTGTARPS